MLSLLACNSIHEADEEVLPQLSAREANTATQRRNKAILNVTGERLELNFNASRAVDTTCTQFHIPANLNYKLALRHLSEGIYSFKITCFGSEGNPFTIGEKKVEISLTNPISVNITLHPVDGDIKAVFEKNYALWREHRIESYNIIFKRGCFCPREITLPAQVEVEQSGDIQITRAKYLESGKPVPPEYLDSFLSIEATFELIAEAIGEEPEVIKVNYDAQYGFPTELLIDYSTIVADDELSIKISDFKPFLDNDVEETFKRNYDLWLKHNIESYGVTFQRGCFCIPDVTLPARIVVEKGKKVQVNYIQSGRPVPTEYLDSFLTIEEIFKLLSEAIEQEAEIIKVSYDSQYGFPQELFIDYDRRIADEEVFISLTDFSEACRLDGCTPPHCQPYDFESEEYQNYANTIELFMTKSIPPQISACLRSTHSDTCINYIDIIQSRSANVITLRAVDSTPPTVGCGDALTPYARFIKVDTSSLTTGDYILRFLGTMRQEVSTRFYYQTIPDNGDCKPYSYDSKEYQNAANTIELVIMESFPIQVAACLRSTHRDTCTEFIDISQSVDASNFTITLKAEERIPPDVACGDALTPYARYVRVNTSDLKTGDYTLIFIGTMGQKVSTTFDYQAGDSPF